MDGLLVASLLLVIQLTVSQAKDKELGEFGIGSWDDGYQEISHLVGVEEYQTTYVN